MPSDAEHCLGHFQAAAELVGHLLFGAEEVGIVLREAADAGHADELARLLEAVDGAELGQPHRQVAVAPRLRLVDHDVVRAVHRLEQVPLAVLEFDRRELAVAVVREMARDLVQLDAADVRRIDRFVAALAEFALDVVFQRLANDRPFRQPEDQARSRPSG